MKSTIIISLVLSLLLTLSSYAAENVDSCFRAIAYGTADERSKALSLLVRPFQTGDDNHERAVAHYAWDSTGEAPTYRVDPEHCKILLEAVPKLIDTLRTEQGKDALIILVRITTFQAPTDYEVWHKWWETYGREHFTRMATPK